jgi:D-lyxose ketol-isomerase
MSCDFTRAMAYLCHKSEKDAVEKMMQSEKERKCSEHHHRVDDALYNRGQGFYVSTLIHSRRLGVN